MSLPVKILNIVGARPNFMKMAPLVHVMARYPTEIRQVLVHTGQHYDENLSRVFFDELEIPRPDINLGVGSGTREEQIVRIQEAFEPIVRREQPDLVLVVGDVNSTIACAEIALRHEVRVAHVEAGLRSFDLDMPEEHNRCATDKIADYLFVTEDSGMKNVEREGLPGRAFFVGNVMIDTLRANQERANGSDVLERFRLAEGDYFVATFHRPSNVDSREELTELVGTISAICARGTLVLPLHPRTQHSLDHHGLLDELLATAGLICTEPLGYLDFLRLVITAKAVITDSGGIQEETTALAIPCLTMRENTERPVTIEQGSNILVGSDRGQLLAELDRIVAGQGKRGVTPPLWDGHAAERIVEILRKELAGARRLASA